MTIVNRGPHTKWKEPLILRYAIQVPPAKLVWLVAKTGQLRDYMHEYEPIESQAAQSQNERSGVAGF
jgi:hypothetical protein